MECPFPLAPHQIRGLDYGNIYPVMDWLIKKLKESRDTRAIINRKQGLYNYRRQFKMEAAAVDEGDAAEGAGFVEDIDNQYEVSKMKDIIFSCKPKRVYLTNRNIDAVGFQDPKRIHQALREFNDLSANSVFQHMLEQIAQLEKDQLMKDGGLGFAEIGGKAMSKKKKAGVTAGGADGSTTGGDGADDETNEDVIKNVQKMLAQQKKADEAQAKKGAKLVKFDLNEGMVGNFPGADGRERSESMVKIAEDQELDKEMSFIKRKT